ncbi:MAG: c-type cytochrome domain-containing protein, partial [Limisphaerales bacterium]
MKKLIVATIVAAVIGGVSQAAPKVTYEEHVLPVFRNACLRCHNPDKAKGDLDLSTFTALLNGGGSGIIVESGDSGASKLMKVVTHEEEPEMPPNGKLEDKEIAIIKQWIEGGLLERSGSKAIKSNKPKMDLSLAKASFGKPDGPPPMPGDLLLDPPQVTVRGTASTALAASPWAPLVALGSQRQILLYNTDTYQLLGVLPFPEGYPADAKFSRNGKLLIVGGGRGAHTGKAAVWDIASGERILTVGEDLDTVLCADISSNQKYIAIAGPDKLVKLYSTATGEMIRKMKKHTDWVTTLEFSPDSKLLASGDRAGGVVIWEGDTGREVNAIGKHKKQITSINWRNTKLVACSSEDGYVKTFDAMEGDEVKSTRTHASGNLHMGIHHNGYIVTAGRDSRIYTWDPNVSRKVTISGLADLPVRVAFTQDFKKVVGSDWTGNVYIWDAAKGTKLATLALNPPSLKIQLANAQKQVTDYTKALPASEKKLADATKAVASYRAQIAAAKIAGDDAVKNLTASLATATKASADADTAAKTWAAKYSASSAALKKAQEQATPHRRTKDASAKDLKAAEAAAASSGKQVAEATTARDQGKASLAKLSPAAAAVKVARDQAQAASGEKDEAVKNLTATLAVYVKRESAAKAAVAAAEKKLAGASAALKTAKDKATKSKSALASSTAALTKLDATIVAETKKSVEAKAASAKAQTDAKAKATALAAAKKKVPTAIAAAKKSRDGKVAALDKSLAAGVKNEATAKTELAAAKSRIALAQQTVNRLNVGEVFAKFWHAKSAFEVHKIEHMKAAAQLEEAQSSFTRINSSLSGVSKALAKKEQERVALADQLKKLQSQINGVKGDFDAAKKKAEEVEKALKAKEKEMSTFEQEYKKRKDTDGK